jgi:predicted component of type VI protein secretion system
VAHFRLLWGSRNLELENGVLLFGRGDECALRTDDPLVSRQHARITVAEDQIQIEDLASRNGVNVNGAKIAQHADLRPGDRIRIGGQDMVLLLGRNTGSWSEAPGPTRRFDALGVLGELAQKALALNRFDEAERLVDGPFQQLVDDIALARPVSPVLVSQATDLAVQLAAATLKREWIERLIVLYMALGRPWPADVIDALYETARHVSGVDRAALRNYIEKLSGAKLGPAERFLLGRIGGLERLLALP